MYNDFKSLKGAIIKQLLIADGDGMQILLFKTRSRYYVYELTGGCCSESWVEHISDLSNLIDHEILETDIVFNTDVYICKGEWQEGSHCTCDDNYSEDLQIYSFKFKTLAGYVDIEFRNSSNGYYCAEIKERGELSTWEDISLAYPEFKKEDFKVIKEDM